MSENKQSKREQSIEALSKWILTCDRVDSKKIAEVIYEGIQEAIEKKQRKLLEGIADWLSNSAYDATHGSTSLNDTSYSAGKSTAFREALGHINKLLKEVD